MFKGFLLFSLTIFSLGNSFSQTTTEYSLIEESKLFTKIPDIDINTPDGQYNISDFYDKSPIILALVFTRCTGICSPLLSKLAENIRILNTEEKFRVLVLSFDPADSVGNMQELSKRFRLSENKQWTFATTKQIDSMNISFNFKPVWDSIIQQFDHEALLVGINQNGYIVKKLVGLRDANALKSLIKAINNEFIISYPLPNEKMILSCFTYDPVTGKKTPSIGLLFFLLPAALLAIVLIALAHYAKRNKIQTEE